MSNSADGIGTLASILIIAGVIATIVTGEWAVWLFLIPGILVGLGFANSIR